VLLRDGETGVPEGIMRIALVSDIQGNLVALDTVLADISRENAEKVVCLGDVALTGPQPHETIERMKSVNCAIIMANCDEWLLDPQPYEVNDERRQLLRDINFWCVKQLSSADFDFIRSFKPMIQLSLGNDNSLLCFHGSPKSNMDIILTTTPDEDVERMFDGFRAKVMAGGHTHVQMFRRFKDTIIINPGSVGSPYERASHAKDYHAPPFAEYACVEFENERIRIQLQRVPLDVGMVKEVALGSHMPHREWWADQWS
jgi:putative phosphoesterase